MKKAEEFANNALPKMIFNDEISEKIRVGMMAGYEQAVSDIREQLVQFFADNITHGCDKGLIINVPDYTTLINNLSDKLGFDLMPILKKRD